METGRPSEPESKSSTDKTPPKYVLQPSEGAAPLETSQDAVILSVCVLDKIRHILVLDSNGKVQEFDLNNNSLINSRNIGIHLFPELVAVPEKNALVCFHMGGLDIYALDTFEPREKITEEGGVGDHVKLLQGNIVYVADEKMKVLDCSDASHIQTLADPPNLPDGVVTNAAVVQHPNSVEEIVATSHGKIDCCTLAEWDEAKKHKQYESPPSSYTEMVGMIGGGLAMYDYSRRTNKYFLQVIDTETGQPLLRSEDPHLHAAKLHSAFNGLSFAITYTGESFLHVYDRLTNALEEVRLPRQLPDDACYYFSGGQLFLTQGNKMVALDIRVSPEHWQALKNADIEEQKPLFEALALCVPPDGVRQLITEYAQSHSSLFRLVGRSDPDASTDQGVRPPTQGEGKG